MFISVGLESVNFGYVTGSVWDNDGNECNETPMTSSHDVAIMLFVYLLYALLNALCNICVVMYHVRGIKKHNNDDQIYTFTI